MKKGTKKNKVKLTQNLTPRHVQRESREYLLHCEILTDSQCVYLLGRARDQRRHGAVDHFGGHALPDQPPKELMPIRIGNEQQTLAAEHFAEFLGYHARLDELEFPIENPLHVGHAGYDDRGLAQCGVLEYARIRRQSRLYPVECAGTESNVANFGKNLMFPTYGQPIFGTIPRCRRRCRHHRHCHIVVVVVVAIVVVVAVGDVEIVAALDDDGSRCRRKCGGGSQYEFDVASSNHVRDNFLPIVVDATDAGDNVRAILVKVWIHLSYAPV